jgi:pimeloyl-ACP methyl ester carboxylesterase
MDALPNIVLVHGAWTDGSSWSGVIQRLQGDGYHVAAAQLLLTSLEADVARVRQLVEAQTGPSLLVGHSFGGAILTQLGTDAPNVVGLAFTAAFAPDQNETMRALITGGPQPPGAVAIRADANGFLWLDPDGFVQYFAADVDPVHARVLSAAQRPIAASELLGDERFGVPAWKTLPSWYLVSENDLMLPPAAQRLFAQRIGATVMSVAAGHIAMVSQPDAVTAFIREAATAVASHPLVKV